MVDVHIVDAFIYGAQGGNAAGVVLDADLLTETQMQAVATFMGLSETVFLSRSEIGDFKLDFFTPNRRVPDCGHATVAAFSLLRILGLLPRDRSSKETVVGVREIMMDGEAVFMAQQAPVFDSVADHVASIAASLGLQADDFVVPPEIVNTGVNFLMVPLKNRAAVASLRADQKAIEAISTTFDLVGYYVFSTEPVEEGHHASARMFAPAYGIPEESATGMAAGPCACFLRHRLGIDDDEVLIEQGFLMEPASPSLLTARMVCDAQGLTAPHVGGIGKRRETTQVPMEILTPPT